jgi:hypothetical protein
MTMQPIAGSFSKPSMAALTSPMSWPFSAFSAWAGSA